MLNAGGIVTVPHQPAFCGLQVVLQAIVFNGVHPLQLEMSRGVLLTIGS